MACFLVPAAEAVITKVVSSSVKSKEVNSEVSNDAAHVPFSRKLSWLTKMLCGGSALLAFEHIWHGEVVPWFPFLSAAGNPSDAAAMLHEMLTTGVTMAVLVTGVWVAMTVISSAMEKKAHFLSDAQQSQI